MGAIILGLFLLLVLFAFAAIAERNREIRRKRAEKIAAVQGRPRDGKGKMEDGKALPPARRWQFPRRTDDRIARVNPTEDDMRIAGEFYLRSLRVECSWCGKLMQSGRGPVSHGICVECSAEHFGVFPGEHRRLSLARAHHFVAEFEGTSACRVCGQGKKAHQEGSGR